MDADVDLKFVRGNGDAADDLVVDAGLLHHALYLVRRLAGARKIVSYDDELAHRIVRQRTFALCVLLLSGDLGIRRRVRPALKPCQFARQLLHEDARDVALRDDAHEVAVLVQDGEASEGVVLEELDGERERHVGLQHDEVRRHVLLARLAYPPALQGLYDVVHRHNAEEPLVLDYRHARYVVALHQVLGEAHRVRANHGYYVAVAHHVADAQALQKLHYHERRVVAAERMLGADMLALPVVGDYLVVVTAFAAAQNLWTVPVHRSRAQASPFSALRNS